MQTLEELIAQTTLINPGATPERVELHPFVAAWEWRYECYHPIHKEMLAAALCFASDVLDGNPPRWLSFLGASGVGKTFLMKQVIWCLHAASRGVVSREADHNRRVWMTKTPTGYRTPQAVRCIPSLDLDDYLAPRDFSTFEVVCIEDIAAADVTKGSGAVTRARISELCQLRSTKWLMLDGNLSVASVEQTFDGRLASRLRRDGSTCIQIPADVPDYSTRK